MVSCESFLDQRRGSGSSEQEADKSLRKWRQFFAHDLESGFAPLKFEPQVYEFIRACPEFEDSKVQENFFFLFSQFHCEAFILFEQGLLYSGRKSKFLPTQEALRYFCREEFYHTRAFRRQLRREPLLDFPRKSLLVHRCHGLKNIFAWILRRDPLAVFIPGAKSETYSILFFKHWSQFKSLEGCTFTKLHELHSQDEAHHVPLDYEMLHLEIKSRGLWAKASFFISTLIMILAVQFIVIFGMNEILKRIFPQFSKPKRFLLGLRIFRLILWKFAPYQDTRNSLRRFYRNKKYSYLRAFRWGAL